MNGDSDDAWAPLPADAQCAHPGELAMLGRRELPTPETLPSGPASVPAAAAPAAPATKPEVAAAAPVEPEDPAVLLALAALRAKIAAAPAPSSMVAEIEERHRRERLRQQRRRQQPPADLQAAVVRAPATAVPADGTAAAKAVSTAADSKSAAVAAAPAPTPVAESALPPVDDGPDPREDEPWFHELPDVEQQRLRRVWAEKRAAAVRAASNVARNGNERLVAGILVFVAVALLGTHVNWHATLGAGVVCGIWWRHARADRFLDPGRAFLCLAVLQVLAMLVARAPAPQLFMDGVLLVAFAAIVGFDGEMRRTGGFDVR